MMITMNKTPPMTPPTIAATSTLSTVAVRAGMFESVEVRLVVVVGVVVVGVVVGVVVVVVVVVDVVVVVVVVVISEIKIGGIRTRMDPFNEQRYCINAFDNSFVFGYYFVCLLILVDPYISRLHTKNPLFLEKCFSDRIQFDIYHADFLKTFVEGHI